LSKHSSGILKATLTQQIAAELRSRILNGALISGDRIWADELAAEFGTSIVPVKEALLVLQSEGFITNIARRGSIVRQFSVREMEEMSDLRELIEIKALELAQAANAIDDVLISALTACNQRIGALRVNGDFSDRAEAFEQDRQFHEYLVRASGHQALSDWYIRLNAQAQIIRFTGWHIKARADKTFDEHARIIEALRRRDIASAKLAVQAHQASIRHDFAAALSVDNPTGTAALDETHMLPPGRRKRTSGTPSATSISPARKAVPDR
jgi:DNA-binding GntR family transcriptional regulator